MSDDVKEAVEALPRKWLNKAVMVLVSIVSAFVMAGFALGSGWVRGVDARAAKTEERLGRAEVDIRGLAVSTENLRAAVEKATAERDADKATRDERARRMDRLLAVLEQQAYNRPKEGSK